MRRWLLRAFVLFLVPVVFVAQGRTAEAAAGDWTGVEWNVQGTGVGQLEFFSFDCGMSSGFISVSGGQSLINTKGYCYGGPDLSPWFCQVGEADCTDVQIEIEGQGCSALSWSPAVFAAPGDGWSSTQIRWDNKSFTVAESAECDPETVCLTISHGETVSTDCSTMALDPIPPPPPPAPTSSNCEHFDLGSASIERLPDTVEQFPKVVMKVTVRGIRKNTDAGVVGGLVWYSRNKTTSAVTMKNARFAWQPGDVSIGGVDLAMPNSQGGWSATVPLGISTANFPDDGTNTYDLAGVYVMSAPYMSDAVGRPAAQKALVHKTTWTGWPSGAATTFATNDPANCRWYVGTIPGGVTPTKDTSSPVSTTSTTTPQSGLFNPVNPDSTAPGGAETAEPVAEAEPTTDQGFFSWIAGLLADLIKAVGRIAGSILDGLLGLFVPGDGVIAGEVDAMKDAWADTPPGVVIGEVAGIPGKFTAPAKSVGCEGPTVGLDLPLLGGDGFDLHPLTTCKESVARIATIVHMGLMVMVYVGAFLAGLRILGSAFGVDASMGRGESA